MPGLGSDELQALPTRKNLWHQTYGYRGPSPPIGQYQIILLGEQRHMCVNNLPRVVLWRLVTYWLQVQCRNHYATTQHGLTINRPSLCVSNVSCLNVQLENDRTDADTWRPRDVRTRLRWAVHTLHDVRWSASSRYSTLRCHQQHDRLHYRHIWLVCSVPRVVPHCSSRLSPVSTTRPFT